MLSCLILFHEKASHMFKRSLTTILICAASSLASAQPPLGTAQASAADSVQGAASRSSETFAALDFASARALAHARADKIKAEDAETAKRQHEAKSARSLHGPKVTFDAKQVWGSKSVDIGPINLGSMMPPSLGQIPGIGAMLGGLSDTSLSYRDDLDGPRAALSLEMPIYTGGAITAKVRAADEAVSESRAQTQVVRDQIDTELAQKYFAVQLARAVVDLRKDMLAQQELELNKARRYEKAGTISKLERMTVEVNRDAAKRDLLSSQTDCAVAERELAGILREEHVGALSNPLFVLTSDLGSLQDWIDKAMAFSPLLQTIDAKRRQADQGVAAAKAAWHPQVYAFATGNLIKHYLAITEPDWIAGIGVRFTLWDNKDRNENIAAARSLATKAQAARSEAVSRLETAVQTAYLRSEQAREQHRLTDSTLALAQENLRLREKSFAEGLSTADEVNDARNKLLGAQIARRVAAYRFVAAWAALNGIAGTMHEFESSANRSDNIFER